MVSKLKRVAVGEERRTATFVGEGYWPEFRKSTFIHVTSGLTKLVEVQVFDRDVYGKYDWHTRGYEEPEVQIDPPHQEGPYR